MDYSNEMLNQSISFYNELMDEESKLLYRANIALRLLGVEAFYKSVFEIDRQKDFSNNSLTNNPYFRRKNYRGVIIFGCGNRGIDLLFELTVLGVKVIAFCDNNAKHHGGIKCGKPVISPNELIEKYSDAFVVVSPEKTEYRVAIYKQLSDMGINPGNIHGTAEMIPRIDYASSTTGSEQYFDSRIIELQDSEVFIDAGAYDGQTSIEFNNKCIRKEKPPRRIYAIEPHSENIRKMSENFSNTEICNVEIIEGCVTSSSGYTWLELSPVPSGHRCSETGNEIVRTFTIDELLDDSPATLIKMDIEGSELAALMGAEKTIRKYSPRLAICVYHKSEDLFVIPNYIKSINTGYKFYLRKYTPHREELVLYAI